ncbi:MAG: response regulator transcription factor [Vicingaceae bacterium]
MRAKKTISNREKEVLSFYAKGLTYNSIAVELAISPATVRKHIENIYKKLQVHNKMEAVQKAIKEKILRA